MRRFALLGLLFATAADAAPRDYAFTWDSQTLDKGKAQPFFELTPRTGRLTYYSRFDSTGGAMLGLTDMLELHLQLDTSFDFTDQPNQISGFGRVTTYWRYHFLPKSDPLGFVTQLKLSLGFEDLTVGGRFVVDYRGTSGIRIAFNAAFERRIGFKDQLGVSMRGEQSAALGYALKNTLTPALEFSAQQSMTDEKFVGSAFFVGGSLTHRPAWGWFTIGMLIQAAAVKGADDDGGDKLELRDHERFLFRFSIGVNAM